MSLTPEDIKILEAPLPLEDHEVRAKGLNQKKDKQQWLIYITQEGIIPLLNRVDPDWSWEVRETRNGVGYVSATGRLTLKGAFRDGTGGSSPNSAGSKVDEDTEKGAETDTFKRAAMRFGVGLYLRSAPMISLDYTEGTSKPWELEKQALEQVSKWYRQLTSAQATKTHNAAPPQPLQGAQVPVHGAEPQSVPKAPTARQELFPDAPTAPTPPKGDYDEPRMGELPQIGTNDMGAILRQAYSEKLVKGKAHFANLILKMRNDGELRDAMNTTQVLEAIRKHEADKDIKKEQAS